MPKRPGLGSAAACFRPEKLDGVKWIDVDPAYIEGRGWAASEVDSPFDRIPTRFQDVLPAIWGLGQSSTGEYFDFETDSTAIAVRCEFESNIFGEQNFNWCAFSGVDLYVYDDIENRWRWAAAAQPFVEWSTDVTYSLTWNLPEKSRRFRMYLPLRNRLRALHLGVDDGALVTVLPPTDPRRSIVYYGTSIIHGAYTVRAGLCLTSRIGRALGRQVVNLGFSGGAKLEAEAAELLAELDPAIFVCDPFHNVTSSIVAERMERFFEILCERHPQTPVLLVSAPPVFNDFLYPDRSEEDDKKTRLFAEISGTLSVRYANFEFLPGGDLYPEDTSQDGIHPNDEAFGMMARKLVPIIQRLIKA